MLRCLIPVILLLWVLASCRQKQQPRIVRKEVKPVEIKLVPYTGMDTLMITHLKEDLAWVTGAKISVSPISALPADAWYNPRKRYVADSLLKHLALFSGDKLTVVMGVTHRDISTSKGAFNNWGVMGLGYCPGPACVISSFRVVQKVKDGNHFRKRMLTLALHELGHTMGLPHCEKECLMKDAGGKMNLDEASTYCPDCHSFLTAKGFLRAGR